MNTPSATAEFVFKHAPDSPAVIFVTGESGCGKTSVVRSMNVVSPGNRRVDVLHIGDEIRKNPAALHELERSSNKSATAVPEVEAFVRIKIRSFVESSPDILVVDGAPRSVDQVLYALELAKTYNRSLLFVNVICPKEERERRLKLRGRYDPERVKNDDASFRDIVRSMADAAVVPGVRYIDTVNS